MTEHGADPYDLRRQTTAVLAPGVYEYTLPDGRTWLHAKWRDAA